MRRLILLTLCVLMPLASHAQHEHLAATMIPPSRGVTPNIRGDLGGHHHPISTDSSRAQEYFDQGMRWFWAGDGVEAAASFAAAEAIDAHCAMCAWGLAVVLTTPASGTAVTGAQRAARDAINRARARQAFATPVEGAIINAQALRLAAGHRRDADSTYADAIHRALMAFPDQYELRVLYADALITWARHTSVDRGRSLPGADEIRRTLEGVLAVNANHPGACHLYVHLMEREDPERGLTCAEHLAEAIPASRHLAHLPVHLYVRVGRYDDAISAGERAWRARDRRTRTSDDPHEAQLLAFAATMKGASSLATRFAARVSGREEPAAAPPVLAMTLAAFGRWSDVLALPMPAHGSRLSRALAYHARGVAFAAKRRWAEAQVMRDSVRALAAREPGKSRLAAVAAALAGELELRRGRTRDAIERFAAAVAIEDGSEGAEPPTLHLPLRHALGRALLQGGRPIEAERVYLEDLARFPENGWSLHGLSEALLAQGRRREAREVSVRFARAWSSADVQLRGFGF